MRLSRISRSALTTGLLLSGLLLAAGPAPDSMSDDPAPSAELRAAFARPSAIPFPAADPFTPAKAALGRALFFDPVLSGSHRIACASCHDPTVAWADRKARGIGVTGRPMTLRSPTLVDIAWVEPLGWDGRFPELEAVAFGPIADPAIMGGSPHRLIADLSVDQSYRTAFAAAFGDATVTRPRIEQALATFERTIVSRPAPFDRWLNGQADAISADARRGFALFRGKGRCSGCHDGWTFSDGSFHDIGVAGDAEIGRGRWFPTSTVLQHAFKTPTLRDVALRPPYMHNGAYPDLKSVVDSYDRGGIDRPSLDPLIKPLHLSETEKAQIIAFLESLTSEPLAPRSSGR